jgi:putative hemolysin
MEEEPLLWPLVLQAALIAVNAVFACAEIALLSLNDSRLEKQAADGSRKAARLRGLKKEPAKFLATIQVGITLAGFLGSAFAAENFSGKLAAVLALAGLAVPRAALEKISLVVITLALSFCTLVFGELVPKRLAMKKAEALAYAMSGLIAAISRVFAPVVWLLTHATNAILRLLGVNPDAEDDAITEEEIRLMIDRGSARGNIEADKTELLQNVFEFDTKTAEEVMTHRRDVAALDLTAGDEEWEAAVLARRHSYYPVCAGSPDNITGILCARDYLALKERARDSVLAAAVREPWFIPATAHIDAVFRSMKKSRSHFAVVVDEYGGMMGIVTMSDLLEELVGDIENDAGAPADAPLIESAGAGMWRVSGAAPLEKVEQELGVTLPEGNYDTFAGFVWSLLERIPEDGSREEVSACGLRVRIEEIREHRLERALVSKEGSRGSG